MSDDDDEVADAMLDGMKPKKKRVPYKGGSGGRYGYPVNRNGGPAVGRPAVHPSTTDRANTPSPGGAGGSPYGRGVAQRRSQVMPASKPLRAKMKAEEIEDIQLEAIARRASLAILDGLEVQGYLLIGNAEAMMAKEAMRKILEGPVRESVMKLIINDLIRDSVALPQGGEARRTPEGE